MTISSGRLRVTDIHNSAASSDRKQPTPRRFRPATTAQTFKPYEKQARLSPDLLMNA